MNIISKSNFIRGLQCHKSLFLHVLHPELRDDISKIQLSLFDNGSKIGEIARHLFPGGVDASRGDHSLINESISYTRELIKSGEKIIYEAVFCTEESLCFIDILVLGEGGWNVYEVKASTSVKDFHLTDLAYQYFAIINSGILLNNISLVHINSRYVKQGEIDPKKLFTIVPLKEVILPIQQQISEQLVLLRKVLSNKKVPDIDIGPHCSIPFDCDFKGHCWKHIPSYSIFDISRIGSKAFDLYREGILETTDIPDDYLLSESQWMQILADRSGKSFRNQQKLDEFKAQLEYPLFFMDFETFSPPIPLYDQTRPYQQIPFQFSLYVQKSFHSNNLLYKFFLGSPLIDPRPEFISNLINHLDIHGSIITYNSAFEIARLREISRDFPEFSDRIEMIISRIIDLMIPFRNMDIYSLQMKGSYSIKKVITAFAPELSYSNLQIQDGGSASIVYESLYYDLDPISINKKRNDLLEYSKMDTLALVKILNIM